MPLQRWVPPFPAPTGGPTSPLSTPPQAPPTPPPGGAVPNPTETPFLPGVAVPGWKDIVVLPGRPPSPGKEAWAEYFAARREARPPRLTPEQVAAIENRIQKMKDNAESAQPKWAKRYGELMTKIDDVQDFFSTLASLGRLILWAAPRLAPRLVPGIGIIILVSDLLNLFTFLGTVAFPFYAYLCGGPRAALAAGIPALVLKNALCKMVWTEALTNPFSRNARLLRQARALGRLPNVGNLLEILQTTQALWGFGLVLGGLYGMVMDLLFTLAGAGRPGAIAPHGSVPQSPATTTLTSRAQAMPPQQQYQAQQAARTLATAPLLAAQSDTLDDVEHLIHIQALLGAVGVVAEFFDVPETPAFMETALAGDFHAIGDGAGTYAPLLLEYAATQGEPGTWAVPGEPRVLSAEQLILQVGPQVTAALEAFLIPRRNTGEGMFYGAAVTQLTEQLWLMVTQNDHAFQFELSTDYKLLTAMMVDGYFPRKDEDPTRLWRFWTAARALQEARRPTLLYPADWLTLAAQAHIDLLKVLDPDAPIPAEWRSYLGTPP